MVCIIMITVIFTCHKRPSLTELCLRRFIEVMPQPYYLHICYDGCDNNYLDMLETISRYSKHWKITYNPSGNNRFTLINDALEQHDTEYYMHFENDFYWVDPVCLDVALNAFYFTEKPLDYIRFEHLPFTHRNFYYCEQHIDRDVCWMREDSPYRFTFNPHLRRFKYPQDTPLQTTEFIKQAEQHHNDNYKYHSACMTGDNWRHLGIYDEGGNYKEYYSDRFTGRRNTKDFDPWIEFTKITDNPLYLNLFRRYLNDNRNKRS